MSITLRQLPPRLPLCGWASALSTAEAFATEKAAFRIERSGQFVRLVPVD